MKFLKENRAILSSLAAFLLIAAFLYLTPPKDTVGSVFYKPSTKALAKFMHIRFSEESESLGFGPREPKWLLGDRGKYKEIYKSFNLISEAASIFDLDDDGFMDVLVAGDPTRIYRNELGKKFSLLSDSHPLVKILADKDKDSIGNLAAIADLDGNGLQDILMLRWPEHQLVMQVRKGVWRDESFRLKGYLSYPHGFNFIDFNRDGFLDLVFGNFLGAPGELPQSNQWWFTAGRLDNRTGGIDAILVRQANGSYAPPPGVRFHSRSYTHSVGVSDFNGDGWPDIFFANDYAHDEMFLNVSGKSIRDVTEEFIPTRFHGNSGMNAEFADVNGDGRFDLYVTNIHKPPFYRAVNVLWEHKEDGRFEFDVNRRKTARCGFSWAAKFADFDSDGNKDLIVSNGRNRAYGVKSPEEGKSFWYQRNTISHLPPILRRLASMRSAPEKFGVSGKYYLSAFERDCLFMGNGSGSFVDVGEVAGIDYDRIEGKGLALADFNNDGLMDYAQTASAGIFSFYRNRSEHKGSWVGIQLVDKHGSQIPHGTVVRLKTSHDRVLSSLVQPLNGFRGQSDPRVHFGLAPGELPGELRVEWSDGQVTLTGELKLGEYQKIYQTTSAKEQR